MNYVANGFAANPNLSATPQWWAPVGSGVCSFIIFLACNSSPPNGFLTFGIARTLDGVNYFPLYGITQGNPNASLTCSPFSFSGSELDSGSTDACGCHLPTVTSSGTITFSVVP